jgi:hypothetical protein
VERLDKGVVTQLQRILEQPDGPVTPLQLQIPAQLTQHLPVSDQTGREYQALATVKGASTIPMPPKSALSKSPGLTRISPVQVPVETISPAFSPHLER